ncbi:MAG: hypothetical protein KGJ99_10565 [Betaproteobacteria bacterium]|nr:hypothetical protein [Betaproteobacteria bacterium]
MMKTRTTAVASLLACVLAAAAATPAVAWERHGEGHYGRGGYYGGGPVWGLANLVVGTVAAVVTAPIAIVAAIAQAPRYYGPGPAYAGPPADSGYYGAPAYDDDEPPVAPDYAPAPAYYAPPAVSYYARPAPAYYAPPVVVPYYGPRRAHYAPRAAYYPDPRARYYAPAPFAGYDRR